MRAYTVDIDEDEGTIIGVVAETAKEAKCIAYYAESIDREWIYVTAKWCKGVDVSGLSKGVIHPYEGVKLGIYSWVEDTCPICKKTEQLYLQTDGTITCNECYENRANIQQQVQLDKAKKCTHPESYMYCCHYYSDSDLCSARSGPCELT